MNNTPAKLNVGDKVLLLSPGGKSEKEPIDIMYNALTELGLNVVVSDQNYLTNNKMPYFPGTDEQKVEYIEKAFLDSEIKAIFCVRGGHGTLKLLDKLNYNLIKDNPTILVGMSDITILQSGLVKHANLEVYHGPVYIHFKGPQREFALQGLRNILFNDSLSKEINLENKCSVGCQNGDFEGTLIGGSLTLMSLIPNEYWYTSQDSILLIEDVKEYLYALDRALYSMELSGKLNSVKAVVVGQNLYNDDEDFGAEFSVVLEQYFTSKGIPVVLDARFGHQDDHLTLPVGRKVTLNLNNGDAKIIL